MQTASAPKDSDQPNWRQRKKANMRRRQEVERRKQLVDGYVLALGGIERVNALQRVEIERCVDMTLLAEGMRGRALRGEAIDIGDLTRLEGAVTRVIRSLNLPSPNAGPPTPTFADFMAGHGSEGGE